MAQMGSEERTMKYTLPDLPWAGLLWGIAKDAPADAVIEVHTPAMLALTQEQLRSYGRLDIEVRLVVAPSVYPEQAA
jgi:hypothetical protein